jgi:hypothetical protein
LPLAALGVHRLRFQLAFGHEADHQLAAEGHQYLSALSPLCVVLAAAVAAELIVRLADARGASVGSGTRVRFLAVAAATAAALIAIYAGQELIEGALSTGHPGGLEGVFAEGGWWSVPVSSCCGIAVALFVRGAAEAVALIARRSRSPARLRHPISVSPKPPEVRLPRLSPLAAAAPGRAPPAAAPAS